MSESSVDFRLVKGEVGWEGRQSLKMREEITEDGNPSGFVPAYRQAGFWFLVVSCFAIAYDEC